MARTSKPDKGDVALMLLIALIGQLKEKGIVDIDKLERALKDVGSVSEPERRRAVVELGVKFIANLKIV